MGIFRYDSKYSAPAREQRDRYMRGEHEEHVFGKDGEILLVIYDEAAYLKDDSDGVRILFTGVVDKGKVSFPVFFSHSRYASISGWTWYFGKSAGMGTLPPSCDDRPPPRRAPRGGSSTSIRKLEDSLPRRASERP